MQKAAVQQTIRGWYFQTAFPNNLVFPGYSAHEDLALMVGAGFTPAQALRAATIGGAEFPRASQRIGKLAPGFDADLVLLSRNPLEKIENSRSIAAVVAGGRVVEQVVPSAGEQP